MESLKRGVPSWMPILCILVITLIMMADSASAMWGQDTVDIVNEMPDGAITVHCSSRDDDLGVHIVPQNVWYHWGFHRNFWGTTLFSCEFTSPTGQQQGLEVWSERVMKHSSCFHKCVWYVRPSGFWVTDYGRIGYPDWPVKLMVPW